MNGSLSKNPAEKLFSYLNARRPIVYIHHFDFQAVDRILDEQGRDGMAGKACVIEEYSEAGGRINFKTKSPVNPAAPQSLDQFLRRFNNAQLNSDRNNYLLVLKDVHGLISEPKVCALLQAIARRTEEAWAASCNSAEPRNLYRVQVVIVDSQFFIPPEIEKITTVIEISPPDDNRISEIIDEVVASAKGMIEMKPEFRPELKLALSGLSEYEIRQTLMLAVENNRLDEQDLPLIYEEKRQLIRKSGLLELIDSRVREVGGLKELQKFIADNKAIFQNPGLAKECGVDAPAGVMIVGMPGCGKSLMAKKVASELDVPLLKLDVGRLMGKYVGESENNLHRAIAVAEAAAPCVLWIDEIEKAFSGIGEDGGGGSAMTRMFGIFLTWMQEKTACIYVVATANNIEKLPPEFLRRGRFDEIFQVGYPTEEERLEILKLHIARRNKGDIPPEVRLKDVAAMLKDEEHYSGADIESIVKEAMKNLFTQNVAEFGSEHKTQWRKLTTDDLIDVASHTKSSYRTQKAKLDVMMKKLNELNARSAS